MSALATVVPAVAASVTAAGWAFSARSVRRLRCQLRTDRLTGLANRDALVHRFARATRRRGAVGLLVLDLDGFKQVNDTCGHEVGNAVLRRFAERLTAVCEVHGGLAVRLHGDEFAVLLPCLPAGLAAARRRAMDVAEAIRTPQIQAGWWITPTASVGVAVAPAVEADLSVMLRAADQRMYAHKRPHKTALPRGSSRYPHAPTTTQP